MIAEKNTVTLAFRDFLHIVKSFFLPIISGGTQNPENELTYYVSEKYADRIALHDYTEIIEETSNDALCLLSTQELVVISKDNSIITIKPCKKNPPFALILKGNTYLVNVGPLNSILRELLNVSHYSYKSGEIRYINWPREHPMFSTPFRNEVYKLALEKGLCRSLDPTGNVYRIVLECCHWAARTYEGNHLGLCVLYRNDNISDNQQTIDLQQKHFAVIATSRNSTLCFNGNLLEEHTELEDVEVKEYLDNKSIPYCINGSKIRIIFCPYGYERIAAKCDGQNIGIVLMANGDILLFDKWQVAFSKRNGQWFINSFHSFSHVLSLFFPKMDDLICRLIYGTCLDVSFEHTGGCLAIIPEYNSKKCQSELISEEDLLFLEKDLESISFSSIEKKEKAKALAILIKNKKFYELGRKLRQELLGMDGATIIEPDGTIIATGAVIQKSVTGPRGGREAAAKKLAEYGFAIKMSSDGDVECWTNLGDDSSTVKKVFQFAKVQNTVDNAQF